jgi:hypothetical protein
MQLLAILKGACFQMRFNQATKVPDPESSLIDQVMRALDEILLCIECNSYAMNQSRWRLPVYSIA